MTVSYTTIGSILACSLQVYEIQLSAETDVRGIISLYHQRVGRKTAALTYGTNTFSSKWKNPSLAAGRVYM